MLKNEKEVKFKEIEARARRDSLVAGVVRSAIVFAFMAFCVKVIADAAVDINAKQPPWLTLTALLIGPPSLISIAQLAWRKWLDREAKNLLDSIPDESILKSLREKNK